jgi:hypothetical protein
VLAQEPGLQQVLKTKADVTAPSAVAAAAGRLRLPVIAACQVDRAPVAAVSAAGVREAAVVASVAAVVAVAAVAAAAGNDKKIHTTNSNREDTASC